MPHIHIGVCKKQGPFLGSPYDKDPSILRSILGLPIYGTPHLKVQGSLNQTLTVAAKRSV